MNSLCGGQRRCEGERRGYVRLESDEGVHGLAGELVIGTDDSSLGDTGIEDESRLDLSSRETMTRHVDDI